MNDLPGEIRSQSRESLSFLGLVSGLLALVLGYTISLNPAWLRTGFEPTRPEHLVGLLAWVVVAITILKWPDVGLLGFVAVVCSHASMVGVRFHHYPSMLLLFTPVLIIALVGRQLGSRGQGFVWDALIVWLVVYGAIIFASSARAVNPRLADEKLFEYLRGLLIFFVVVNLLTSRLALRRAVWVMVLVGAFLGTISVYQVFTSSYGFEFGGFGRIELAHIVGRLREPRIGGPMGDPNFYAQTLVPLVPLTLYRLWDESSTRLKVIAAYTLAVVVLAVVFTYSRGGAVALGLVLVLSALNRMVKIRHVLLSLLMFTLLTLFIPEQFGGRLRTLNQLLPARNESTIHLDSAIEGRKLVMRAAWEMFSDHPFLGVASGNYSEHFEEYAERVGSVASSYEKFAKRRLPHSLYLEVAGETGLVGLAVFATIIVSTLLAFRSAYLLFKAAGDLQAASLVISLALGFCGFLTTSVFLHGHYMRYFWLLVAMAVAAKQTAKQQVIEGDRG